LQQFREKGKAGYPAPEGYSGLCFFRAGSGFESLPVACRKACGLFRRQRKNRETNLTVFL
jgi:hypothetical protein